MKHTIPAGLKPSISCMISKGSGARPRIHRSASLSCSTAVSSASNTVVLGCSLFSHVPSESHMAVSMGLNDFYQIDKWDVDAHNEMHERDLSWLNAQVAGLEGSDARIAILSHWSPSRDARVIEPKHAASSILTAFSTDLSKEKCFKSGNVKLWAFGHTHHNCDFVADRDDGAGPLRIMANQRGYYFAQSEGFDVAKTVEV